jgi:hypothetical protein
VLGGAFKERWTVTAPPRRLAQRSWDFHITQYVTHRFRYHCINLMILGTTAKGAMLDRLKAAADGVEVALGQFMDAVNRQCWRRIILGVRMIFSWVL